MIGPEFASCILKLGRAEHHFKAFQTEFSEWSDDDPYSIVKKSNTDGSRYTVSLTIRKSPPVDRWALIYGDCIQNLRSTLDTLIYALAVRDSRQNPPPNFRNLQFPVTIQATEFPSKQGMIAPLSTTSQAFIERFQPYNRPQQPIPMALAVLSELSNTDKHRLLNVTFQHLGNFKASYNTVLHGTPQYKVLRTAISGDTDIAFITLDPPQTDVDFDVEAFFVITTNYAVPNSVSGIVTLQTLLEALISEVRTIINNVP